jgi:hypothetical protein
MHNWYVEDVTNRRMRYEREQAAQARIIQNLADVRAPRRHASLATWLRRNLYQGSTSEDLRGDRVCYQSPKGS